MNLWKLHFLFVTCTFKIHIRLFKALTEIPSSLNETDPGIVNKERDSFQEEVWIWLEISIKYGNIFTLLHIAMLHPFLQGPCFVPFPVVSYFIGYVHAFALPHFAFKCHQILHKKKWIKPAMNQNSASNPSNWWADKCFSLVIRLRLN